ncbi:MAG: single-stranded DNA-binding protein [Marinomonas gallaica]
MNLFTFSGNLGRDAEVKHLPSGSTVCEFSVAVRSGYGDREKTTWVRCALFGKRAEGNLPQYLVKGAQVFCSGELELQEWEGQNGKGAAVAVTIDRLDLAGGKSEGAPQTQPQQQQAPAQPAAQPQSYGSFDTDWSGYKPSATTNGATIEQVKKKYNGDLQAAIKNGHVEKEAFGANDFVDDIPF